MPRKRRTIFHSGSRREQMGFIDYKAIHRVGIRTADMTPEELVAVILQQVRDADTLLGHAKDTAGSLRYLLDRDEVKDENIADLAMYLEDDIDELENGVVYDLVVRLKDAIEVGN